jgi:hypothetical protein
MQHDWVCYTTHCTNCGHSGLLQVWSEGRGWGFATSALVVAAVSRIHPENSVMRCIACLSSVVTLERQPDSPRCASAACQFDHAPKRLKSGVADIACPMHSAAKRFGGYQKVNLIQRCATPGCAGGPSNDSRHGRR